MDVTKIKESIAYWQTKIWYSPELIEAVKLHSQPSYTTLYRGGYISEWSLFNCEKLVRTFDVWAFSEDMTVAENFMINGKQWLEDDDVSVIYVLDNAHSLRVNDYVDSDLSNEMEHLVKGPLYIQNIVNCNDYYLVTLSQQYY